MPTSATAVRPPAPGGWRRLGVVRGDAGALHEGSVALLDGFAGDPRPVLRWYVADRPALVLGRGQRADQVRAEVPVLRRHSGGGAVLMDADLLSLDVALPAGHPLLDGDLGAVFLRVGRAWAGALEHLGVDGLTVHEGASSARRLGEPRERLLASVCYATAGRGEVLHRGRKLVGLAQRRRRAGALVQCGLLLRWRPAPLLAALGADPDDAEVHAAAVGLRDLPAPSPPLEDVVAAVEERIAAPGVG